MSTSSAPSAVFDAVMQKWIAAQISSDYEAMASLYTSDAMFFGSKAKLYRGPEGVLEYMSSFPKGSVPKVVLHEVQAIQLAADVIAVGFYVDFHTPAGPPLLWRAIFALKRENDGVWRIATHHAAPKEAEVEMPIASKN